MLPAPRDLSVVPFHPPLRERLAGTRLNFVSFLRQEFGPKIDVILEADYVRLVCLAGPAEQRRAGKSVQAWIQKIAASAEREAKRVLDSNFGATVKHRASSTPRERADILHEFKPELVASFGLNIARKSVIAVPGNLPVYKRPKAVIQLPAPSVNCTYPWLDSTTLTFIFSLSSC